MSDPSGATPAPFKTTVDNLISYSNTMVVDGCEVDRYYVLPGGAWRLRLDDDTSVTFPNAQVDFTPGQEDFELTDDVGTTHNVRFYMARRHMDVGDLP